MNVRGELNAQAQVNGVVSNPQYQAKISGKELQLIFSDLGIVFPHGVLDASITGNQLTLNTLKFTESIKPPPRHDNLTDLRWLNETGYIESTGQVDIKTGRGAITTTWKKFPLMQNPEAWLVASGQAQLAESEKTWNLTGQLVADAAYFSVPKQAAPRLSSDVVVLRGNAKRNDEKSTGLQTSLDFSIGTGNNFIFVGRGIDTRLDGDIRIRSKNSGSILATGSIQTVGGTYEGYGQQLAIDRGILNFQGPIDNPGLNVRAIRRGLPVEAGVEVDGTVARPTVHLISEPNVPDPDKLSWMVLGRPSDQMAGSEATLLMSAAGAIFGGDSGGSVPASIAHSLGLEDMTFGTTSTSPESQLPTQTVAGTINSTAPSDQVFSVGKRITPNIVFSIERSLTDASNGLKLTWHLTRRFSIIGRAGSDTAIDGQYIISFD
jgi:translocation and assembly module TamB